jgi:hypothetical protein
LLGNFNVPDFDWNFVLPFPNCHFYTKLKGDVIHSPTCLLSLNQHNYPDTGSNLLDIIFSEFADLSVDHAEYGPDQDSHFHPPCIID